MGMNGTSQKYWRPIHLNSPGNETNGTRRMGVLHPNPGQPPLSWTGRCATTALMDRLRARITDKRVLALVKGFLKAGVLTATGSREGSITGPPQGGILSPLLANIALSVLDDHFTQQWQTSMATEQQRQKRRRHGLANYRLIRYADDFVVLVTGEKGHAQALRDEVATVLAPMGLRLSPEKTRVVHIDDGFDFLGFTIRRMRKRGSHKHFVYTLPPTTATASIKGRVKTMTY